MATNEIKKNIIRRLLFSGAFVMAMIFIMISVSFSWMNNNPRAKVSNIQIEVVEANNLLVKAENGEEWSKTINMDFKEGFKMRSVCGDGKNFYDPILSHTDDSNDFVAIGYEAVSGTLEDNGIYEFAFSCIVENSLTVYLDKGSSLTPAENSNLSAYGDFSAGHVCAAMRVAFFQRVDGEYVLRCIWIPNSTTELDPSTATSLKAENGAVEDRYVFVSGENGSNSIVIETNGEPNGSQTIDNVTYVWGDLEEDLEIGVTEENTQQDFKLVLWIDGQDRECHNALMDGLVSVNLKILVDDKIEKGE